MKLSTIKKSKIFWFFAIYFVSLVCIGGFMFIVHLIPQGLMFLAK